MQRFNQETPVDLSAIKRGPLLV